MLLLLIGSSTKPMNNIIGHIRSLCLTISWRTKNKEKEQGSNWYLNLRLNGAKTKWILNPLFTPVRLAKIFEQELLNFSITIYSIPNVCYKLLISTWRWKILTSLGWKIKTISRLMFFISSKSRTLTLLT